MSATVKNSLAFLQEMLKKEHDLSTDTLKIALMDTAFTFDPATHDAWADVSASEIAAGNGYTAGGQALAGVSVDIVAAENRVEVNANTPAWTASGGAIATTGSAIVYNDTHASKTIVQHINFPATHDTPDGKVFQVQITSGLRYFFNHTG